MLAKNQLQIFIAILQISKMNRRFMNFTNSSGISQSKFPKFSNSHLFAIKKMTGFNCENTYAIDLFAEGAKKLGYDTIDELLIKEPVSILLQCKHCDCELFTDRCDSAERYGEYVPYLVVQSQCKNILSSFNSNGEKDVSFFHIEDPMFCLQLGTKCYPLKDIVPRNQNIVLPEWKHFKDFNTISAEKEQYNAELRELGKPLRPWNHWCETFNPLEKALPEERYPQYGHKKTGKMVDTLETIGMFS
ncbi:hypothetical protein BMW23_0488 [Bodo saltans virus]|uniref:Uncharacterized protein n=1 Tax=Bodo saltans virus TaxID=2024608 RepID=A0A2H4UUF2_9VIRU|nr:hypothetical protein QJ851_gp0475 [Bodo saltans virus]ATZ80538.1 hypothetical protein BMW23_0488 [Bodo saltans virus]